MYHKMSGKGASASEAHERVEEQSALCREPVEVRGGDELVHPACRLVRGVGRSVAPPVLGGTPGL